MPVWGEGWRAPLYPKKSAVASSPITDYSAIYGLIRIIRFIDDYRYLR